MTTHAPLTSYLHQLRGFYNSGATRTYAFRKQQLQQLQKVLAKYEKEVYQALHTDLKKSAEESWVTELGFVQSEIRFILKHLKQWMQPERVPTNLVNLPSSSYILPEPLGIVLIIAPWNYPLQLLMAPLAGAIAAGNCVVLKASEFAPATAAILKTIVEETFPKEYILYVEGDGATVVPAMMNGFCFDHVFYTGSTHVGRLIYQMAADQLVPVTLELGGKSPCVVESDANIKVAARRIAVTKFSNAGQMCVAPDYVLVHASRRDELISALKHTIESFYTADPRTSESYGKIINAKQFDRLVNYLQQGQIIHGGNYDRASLYIEPTLLYNVPADAAIMRDEIFGPILPIIPFTTLEEGKAIIARQPNPLSFYVYTSSSAKEKAWLEAVPFGGGCVNNSSWHFTNHHLPFGGRGNSGTGTYHGKSSFDVFSHRKAIMKTPLWFDPALKYPPFKGKLSLFKWIIR